MDGVCTDINECSDNTQNDCNVASQISFCTNNEGSYTCSCVSGYQGNGKVSIIQTKHFT